MATSKSDVPTWAESSAASQGHWDSLRLWCLVQAAQDVPANINWLVATLGRMPPDTLRNHWRGTRLLEQVEPMLLVAHGASWLATENALTDSAFLMKRSL